MNKLMALCYFVLSLFGCDTGGSTYVHRTVADGIEALYSRTTVEAGVARFECLGSASGQCHYTVLRSGCTPSTSPDGGSTPGCADKPIEQFTLANGHSRQIPGLQRFDLCVATRQGSAAPGCKMPEPIATQ